MQTIAGGTASVTGGAGGSGAGASGAAGAGMGGTSNGGAGSGGGGAAGAGGSGAVSGASACIEYATAACQRIRECRGVSADPLSNQICRADACPDNVFSEGSLRTIEGALACAETWRTFSCAMIDAGAVPSCASGGTRAPGETCSFGSQCTSGSCTAGSGTCGVCSTLAPRGSVCDGQMTTCEPGLVCVGSNGGATTGICGDLPPPGGVGAPCVNNGYCEEALFCATDTMTCQTPEPVPGAGSPCSVTTGCATFTYCESGGTCRDNPRIGEPCTAQGSTGIYVGPCFGGRCDQTASPPTCVERPAPGDPCIIPITRGAALEGGCRDGALCDCDEPGCSVGDTGTCHTVALEGDACTDPLTRCNPAFECVSGVCRARQSQGIFERVCGG